MRLEIVAVALLVACGVARMASADQHGEKPLVACDKIVETYKHSKSVDETASAVGADQSRVAECLKGAGITAPAEDDE